MESQIVRQIRKFLMCQNEDALRLFDSELDNTNPDTFYYQVKSAVTDELLAWEKVQEEREEFLNHERMVYRHQQ
jgi:hypothetical protein